MIVEEKKADEMFCCGPVVSNKCYGSRCMAWRWTDVEYDEEGNLIIRDGRTHGYCGLAGRP